MLKYVRCKSFAGARFDCGYVSGDFLLGRYNIACPY